MPKVKIKGKIYKAATLKENSGWKMPNMKIEQPRRQQTFYKTAEQLPEYHRLVIKRVAVRYSGEELDRKLSELKFCSLETAKQILKEGAKK